MRFRAHNRTQGRVIASDVARAASILSRMKGLLGRKDLPAEQGLWIEPCSQIHTFFMAFSIDAVFLSEDLTVVEVVRKIVPWRVTRWVGGARSVLELSPGGAEGVKNGDRIEFEKRT